MRKLLLFFIPFFAVLMMGCERDNDYVVGGHTFINKVGDGGVFSAINLSTLDTVHINVALLSRSPQLKARLGDQIKLTFIPDSVYKDNQFSVFYTFPDSVKIEGIGSDYKYIFNVDSWFKEEGTYTISMSCDFSETKEDTFISVTGFGSMKLAVSIPE